MATILLDTATWDWTWDADGNIAMAEDPYAMAQDVASACRLFLGELWYDRAQGVPYFERILGRFPPAQYLKLQLVAAALTVPGVVSAKAFLTSLDERKVGGQVQFIAETGAFVVGTEDLQAALPWYVSGADRAALQPAA
jgi:hypothetical protein